MSRSLPPPTAPRRALLAWYRGRRSTYPWRVNPLPDPYAVLVSEVMLQQTQASRVAPRYPEFLRRFPTVEALAAATLGTVIRAWSGLGYNRRAVALFEAARTIVQEYQGRVPSDPDELQQLPGVGPYTAAAVASIAFGVPIAAVDTNVRRVIARVAAGRDPDGVSLVDVRVMADTWLDRRAPGAWNQALMDLGRDVCRPQPRCHECPLASHCRYRRRKPEVPAGWPKVHRATARFDGSFRQLRGRIVAALRERSPLTVHALARLTGRSLPEVTEAIRALVRDGLVEAGRGALAGRPSARVSLSS
ncbi:MAG: winged helix-turn-helix transcriptional regulator [Actinomycetota bacterium]|nr:winged helix-turn-helix transcriptional regulator [Actinomycetota bacterium]